MIRKSEISLQKYWVKHSGYFRIVTRVVLGMGITYGKLQLCRDISGKRRENKISMRDYNYRIFYDLFNHPFPYCCVKKALNIPPMTIDNSNCPNKRSHCTSDPFSDSIYDTYIKYVCKFTTNYYSPQVIYLYYDYPKPHHTIMSDKPFYVREKIGYCPRIYYGIVLYKKGDYISTCVPLIIGFNNFMDVP